MSIFGIELKNPFKKNEEFDPKKEEKKGINTEGAGTMKGVTQGSEIQPEPLKPHISADEAKKIQEGDFGDVPDETE